MSAPEKKLDTKSARVLDAHAPPQGFEPDERGPRIGASIPVGLIRQAYDKWLPDVAVATRAALDVGRKCLGTGDADEDKYDGIIIAIARRQATLRGFTPHITYHTEPCVRCNGTGEQKVGTRTVACECCKGDGFAPANEGKS